MQQSSIRIATRHVWLKRLRMALIVACVAGRADAQAPKDTAPPPTPGEVAQTFYRWYVPTFRSDHDPLWEIATGRDELVSSMLLHRVKARVYDEDAMTFDYFLQIPDTFRPGREVRVRLRSQRRERAEVEVVMSGGCPSVWRVYVQLLKEAHAWKIDRVLPVPGQRRPRTAPRGCN